MPAPGLLSNDHDPKGHALSAALMVAPRHSKLTVNSDGSFTYQPEHRFIGTDRFDYHASNGTDTSNDATVTVQLGAAG